MSAKRLMLLALTGAAALACGFLLAEVLSGDSRHTGSGALPSTVSVDDSGSRVPGFSAHGRLPPLAVSITTPEASVEGGSEYAPEPEYEPEPEYVPTKEEKKPYVPPSNPPTAAPEVTVGEE